jgi:hypothetical protein
MEFNGFRLIPRERRQAHLHGSDHLVTSHDRAARHFSMIRKFGDKLSSGTLQRIADGFRTPKFTTPFLATTFAQHGNQPVIGNFVEPR